ncbi:hypothetical protein Y032_0005g2559 [Ancylostoma ceylanicum]|uniref:Uncharacterized protein n=1 Tax=Ancylostoma ceylanicum TaxID=53326 RepID=A0A016VTA5_9BILA|nr:hypothetical protein Y032_0005g2559 [Ancylostoma ceylanicum]
MHAWVCLRFCELYPASIRPKTLHSSDWEVHERRFAVTSNKCALSWTPGKPGQLHGSVTGTAASAKTKFEGLSWLPRTRRTVMTFCTFNARTLASEASIKDLMMQTRTIRISIIYGASMDHTDFIQPVTPAP